MPSLDGYSLNKKIDEVYDSVQHQIYQLEVDFQHLYNMMKDMQKEKDNDEAKPAKSKKKAKESKK